MSGFVQVLPPGCRSGHIDAAGIRTHYLEAGRGEPLVLVHGGGSGADAYGNWRDCIPLLAPRFRVLAVDMVGFGQTAKPDPASYAYSQDNRNKHLLGFLDAMHLERAFVVGNSMGGATALGLTMAQPERVSKLVLMGSAGIRTADQPTAALKAIIDYDFTVDGMRRLIAALTGPGYQPSEEMVAYRHGLSIDPATRAALQAINAVVKQGGMLYDEAQVRQVKVPTLVMNGKLDQVSTISRALKFLELLDNSWGYFVPHVGHWIMIEAPADFSAAVSGFLLRD